MSPENPLLIPNPCSSNQIRQICLIRDSNPENILNQVNQGSGNETKLIPKERFILIGIKMKKDVNMQQVQNIIQLLDTLSLSEKAEVVKMIMSDIQSMSEQHTVQRKPLDSAYGICAGCQPEPSEEDIARMRKEAFMKFSERDI